jgi:hypothetical protein
VGAWEETKVKIKKTVSNEVVAANRVNARNSTGPRSIAGKRRSRLNSLKHGFFAKELQLGEEDRPEFGVLRDRLLQQFPAATPLEEIAAENIVCCCWRCKRALRFESSITALQQTSNKEPDVQAAVGADTNRMERWYGTDYLSLKDGLRFLRGLYAVVADSGLIRVEQDGPWKESLIKAFGLRFYDRLMEWKGMGVHGILLADHLAAMQENFDSPPSVPENPKIVADPKLKQQMVLKLVDAEIEHLEILVRTRSTDFREIPQALAEFSPRYYADASRDLHRAVEWFLKLKSSGL